jgi:glycosyltransferase involved in cell wall biosynthesis
MKKKVLILGALISPLIRERVSLSRKLGYEVLVLDFNSKEIFFIENVKIKTYFNNKIFSKILSPFILLFNILLFKPDVIHVHWALQDFNSLILFLFKNVIVSTMGSDIMPNVVENKIRRILLILLLKNCKIVTVKSLYMKKILFDVYKIPEEKIKIIKWGLNACFFESYKKEIFLNLDISEEKKIFLCSRSMQPLYRKKEILEAFIKYKESSNSTAVLIISKFSANDKYLFEIEKIIDNSRFKNDIFLIEGVNHSEIPKLLNFIDYIVMYPLSDGMPQSLYEAMAFGKFIIVPKLEHYKEILIHQNNAYFADDNTLINAFDFSENKSNKIYYENFNKKYSRFFLNQEKELVKLKEIYES